LLKKVVEWGDLDRLWCTIKLLPNPKNTIGFHDFDQYERLLAAEHETSANERTRVSHAPPSRRLAVASAPKDAPSLLRSYGAQGGAGHGGPRE